jgi:hypothetical protein
MSEVCYQTGPIPVDTFTITNSRTAGSSFCDANIKLSSSLINMTFGPNGNNYVWLKLQGSETVREFSIGLPYNGGEYYGLAYGDCVTCPTQTPTNTPTPTQTPTQTQTPSNSLAGVTVSTSLLNYPTCYNSTNASVTLSAAGGSGSGYQFRVDGGAWQSQVTFFNLGTALYYFEAKDGNGSVSTTGVSVDFRKSAPSCTINVVDPVCYGGTGSISVLNPLGGNSGAYTVSINGGITYQSFPQTYSNLVAGDYSITVRDTLGCTISYPQYISQPSSQSSSITSVVGATSGDNGSLTISSSGGVWNKTYRLYKDSASPYNDYPTDNLVAIYTDVTSGSPSISVTGLACGYYWLHVTDANGCVTTTIEHEVTCPAPATVYYAYQIIRCSDNTTQSMTSLDYLPSQFTTGTRVIKINNICYQIDYYLTTTLEQGILHLVDGQYSTFWLSCNECEGGGGGGQQQI